LIIVVIGAFFPMNRRIQKIFIPILACLFGLNLAVGGSVPADPCPPSLCPSGVMEMDHHNGMIDFTRPMHGCGEDCNNIFCDLLKDPFQEANAVSSSSFPGSHYPVIAGTVDVIGQLGFRASSTEFQPPVTESGAARQIPLYIEHLSLII